MLENKCDWKISKADQNGNVYYYFPKDEDEFKEAVVKNGGMSVYVYQEGKFIDEFHTKSQGDKWTSSILNYLKTMSKDGGIFYRYYKNCKFFAIPKNTFSKDDFKIIKDNINNNIPLNQILYGPPGTGKTYHTIDKALEIFGENLESRDEKKAKFDEYVRKGQIVFTTFHQSYGYEEFVEGIKPVMNNEANSQEIQYKIKDGIFKDFCDKAFVVKQNFNFNQIKDDFLDHCREKKSIIYKNKEYKFEEPNNLITGNLKIHINYIRDMIEQIGLSYGNLSDIEIEGYIRLKIDSGDNIINNYKIILDYFYYKYINFSFVFVIDEINRGNVSKIFGELITLIEPSKRIGEKEELKVKLPYSGEEFGVPKNVYIIGTMNTADRSITSLDTALRRRFEFIEMMPDVSKLSMDCEGINLQELLKAINTRIEYLLDREKTIGHAFFISVENLESLKKVFKNRIIPLLQEYFYNDYALIDAVLNKNGMLEISVENKDYLKNMTEFIESDKVVYKFSDSNNWSKDTFIKIYE
ncbi:restriction endonuclease [Campylobacter jejuni subsp. jejuni]|nr:AAA family ATPase [Campylobacter jejuni]AJP34654.1 5-methylcytosine-specific restriction enzyme B [Campylobacter jejuni subsp. jejuni]AQX68653.1 restriction endonuclease [Campylobacter jejuni]AQY74060.1 restriction endonuclease [Campylobacter jejuni subsp. jejuni]AWB36587.1 McrBC 5-methylcytosine restriction system, component McrB [Campylobacter jejuni]